MSFIEHLEDLRWHILRALAVVLIISIAVFLAEDFIFETLLFGPKREDFVTYRMICGIAESLCFSPPDFRLLTRDLGEQFITHIKVSFWMGLVIAFPYIIWELWRFLKPGLHTAERRASRGFVLTSSILFYIGVIFGYFIIAPFAVTFLAGYDVGATSAPTLTSYVNYMTMFTVPTGVVFELPVLAYILSKIGLLTPGFMRQYRKHAFVLFIILAAIITPPDIITQFLIALPLYFLYEVSIHISARVNRAREKELS